MIDTLAQDLRYAARALRKTPGFTAVAALTLALGIGATTAVFSVVDAALLRPPAFHDPDRLLLVADSFSRLGVSRGEISTPEFLEVAARSDLFEGVAAFTAADVNLTGRSEPERVRALLVSPGFFSVVRAEPLLGRAFGRADESPGITQVAVISQTLWRRRFGSDPAVLGTKILLDGDPYTVVGVAADEFRRRAAPWPSDVDVWVPAGFTGLPFDAPPAAFWLGAIARVRPDVPLGEARAEVSALARWLEAENPERYPRRGGFSMELVPVHEQVSGGARPALLVLLGAVALVLLIACANVAGLLLARFGLRRREVALRAALGATRGRVVRQLLTEALLLAALGGGLGILLAVWCVDALAGLGSAAIPRAAEVAIDARVLGFALAVSLSTGLLFGTLPALGGWQPGLRPLLMEGRGASPPAARGGFRRLLVTGEIALALTLLAGAGLLIRSLWQLRSEDPGFDPRGVLALEVSLPQPNRPDEGRYADPAARARFFQEVLERLEALPGVQAAGAVTALPLTEEARSGERAIALEGGGPTDPDDFATARWRTVTPSYFETMRIPLLRGRPLGERDDVRAPHAVLVNEAMARRYWPGEDPVGRSVKLGGVNSDAPWMTVVGVVSDTRDLGLGEPPAGTMYASYLQQAPSSMTLVVRGATDPASLARAALREIRLVDPAQPAWNVRTLEEVVAGAVAPQRLLTRVLAAFAALALVLAAVGVYGVLAHSVAQRTAEIGIRVALGATRADVVTEVLGQALPLVAGGIALGLAASWALSRFLGTLLYEVRPGDPLTLGAVTCLLAAVAFLACAVPARRAARVDPMVAMRSE